MTALVIGGSVAGLASALVLNEHGHDVRILERDPNPPPDDVAGAHSRWPRPTVPQATHSHAFATLGCDLLREHAPDVYAELLKAGASEIELAAVPPPTLTDRSPQPGDDELRMIACRRSTFELMLRQRVLERSGVTAETGTTVRGLELAANGAGPRVTGVQTATGRALPADIVVDAAGRRSPAARWLSDAGVPVAEDKVEGCEITYYTRFYRLLADSPPGPLNRGFGAGGLWDHYTAVLFLGDNNTFSISIGVLPDDTQMKLLREEPVFTAALRATPLLAPWLEPGVSEPISDVSAMGGLDNSFRGAATPEQPEVAGLFHIGDSVGTTNPAYGRGVSLTLAHAAALGDVLAGHPDDPAAQRRELTAATARLFQPWLADAIRTDRGRAMLWQATVAGEQPPAPPPGVITFGTVVAAAAVDPVVWRRVVRMMMMLAEPDDLYADPEIQERVGAVLAAGPPPQFPAPSRQELVDIVTEAAN